MSYLNYVFDPVRHVELLRGPRGWQVLFETTGDYKAKKPVCQLNCLVFERLPLMPEAYERNLRG
jgi:hypothetical protein